MADVGLRDAPASDGDEDDTVEYDVDHNAPFDPTNFQDKSNENSIWSLQDFALRDLLVYLVQKHRIDEVYDSKAKAKNWEQLYEDFHHFTDKRVAITQLQIVRKWHNWKQYNKAHKKPHPFVVCGNLDPNVVLQKCAQLCEQATHDPTIAAIIARGPVECVDPMSVRKADTLSEGSSLEDLLMKRHVCPEIIKIIDRDFLPGKRASNQTTTWAFNRLRHDIELMKLAYQEEMWRIKLENVKLLNIKLQRKAEAIDLKYERVQIELAMKRHCIRLGLSESVLQG